MANETPEKVAPDWRYYVRDVTQYIGEPLLTECGGVYAVYAFDAASRTYCCEATPSYAMLFLRHEPRALPDGEDARERIDETLMECDRDADLAIYVHTSHVALDTCQRVGIAPDPEDTEDDQTACVLDFARCNHEAQIPE